MTKQKKTFVFITNTDYTKGNLTGGHKRFLELVNGISEKNEVILISKKIPGLRKGNIKFIEIKENKHRFLPAHLDKMLIICKMLRRERKGIRYDYAISFGPVDTISYKISGYSNIVMLLREDFVGYRKIVGTSAIKLIYFKWMEEYAVKHSQKIIVQCNDDKNVLIERYGNRIKDLGSRIYVQTNNINASWMLDNNVKERERNGDVVKIVFIGNFSSDRKGHKLLLPAVARLIDDGYNIKLTVVGDGKQLERYKEMYKKYDGIVFVGRVDNTNEILTDSDFEVVPSLMDSCPNTVLEGISAGIAVYGSNVGGIKEILQDKKYLFELDTDSIYRFVGHILDGRLYLRDEKEQRAIKKRLSFDWSDKISAIIESGRANVV